MEDGIPLCLEAGESKTEVLASSKAVLQEHPCMCQALVA